MKPLCKTETNHAEYFYATTFGLSSVPCWHKRHKELITDITELHSLKLAVYWEDRDAQLFDELRYQISKKYKISYACIDLMLGVCCLDMSNPYGCLYDFLQQSNTKLTRTTR